MERGNEAQILMLKMGVPPGLIYMDRSVKGYSPSFTKKGPGRKHRSKK